MPRIYLYFCFLWICSTAVGQLHPSCPVHQGDMAGYENPLYDQWLSLYDVKYLDIFLKVDNMSTEISGEVALVVEAVRDVDTVVLELQDALVVNDAFVSDDIYSDTFDQQVEYEHLHDAVYIILDRTHLAGEKFKVMLTYDGEAGQNRGFFAGITSAADPDYDFQVTYTLSEPLNARDWFPVKQVLEDKIDSVRVRLQCRKQLMAASNGILMSVQDSDPDNHVFTWKSYYPVAYYLISFAVADYRDFSFMAGLSEAGDSVLVQNYIYNSDAVLSDWKEEILETGPMITAFSELITNYPFSNEKYGHAMAPLGGGMEHQTMTTIHDFSFSLVAHELAHQWFGDYVTCGNWQDIWINEGFASYMEYVAAQKLHGQEAADKWMAQAMSLAKGETKGSVFVPAQRVEENYRLFDYGLTYKKGAILLHMIRYQLDDDELFFNVLTTYLEQYGNGHATGEDFRLILESISGMDFSCFFDQWYYGEGYPRFTISWSQQGDSLEIRSEQSTTAPSATPFFETPFDLQIRFMDGSNGMVRLVQDHPQADFTTAIKGIVTEVIFDPGNNLLANSHVVQQLGSDRGFSYGPNPVSEELFIQFANTSHIDEIRLTTMTGQEIIRHLNADNPVTMNLSALADGPYFLVMYNDNTTYKERIVKISNHP